jgi:hypothetical protein
MTGAISVAVNDEKIHSEEPSVRTLVENFCPGMHLDVVMTLPLID